MSEIKSILMHSCCAPCLIAPYFKLNNQGYDITAFWYNINIHPYTEYQLRKEALEDFAQKQGFPLIIQDEYGLQAFVKAVAADISQRCNYCYETRLKATAKLAAEQGFDAFSSTLFYSRYQNHELMIKIASHYSQQYDIPFYYEDFRPLWYEGIKFSKEAGMYRQKYCGCIFSEEDRYLGQKSSK